MRTFHTLLVASALAVVVTLTGVTAASAHDDLVASTPAPGEQLSAAPPEIRMEFVSDVMSIGANIMVIDAAGSDWSDGEAVVAGTTVTVQLLPDMPVAGYQVRWQVVGSDGHPISGFIPFTIGDAKPMGLAATDAEEVPDTVQAPQVQASPEGNPALRFALLGGVGAVIALGLLLLITFLRLRVAQRPAGTDAGPGPVDNS